jgi:hypothetical protein
VARRSQALNLVYLPLYIAGMIGPALGAGIASVTGPHGPFFAGAIVFAAGAVAIAARGSIGGRGVEQRAHDHERDRAAEATPSA